MALRGDLHPWRGGTGEEIWWGVAWYAGRTGVGTRRVEPAGLGGGLQSGLAEVVQGVCVCVCVCVCVLSSDYKLSYCKAQDTNL